MEGTERETLVTILSHCHQTCCAIETRLTALRVPPDLPTVEAEKEPESTPESAVEALTADRKQAESLLTRLRRIEDHAGAIQESMKGLV